MSPQTRQSSLRFVAGLDNVPPYEPGPRMEHVKERYGLSTVVKLGSNEFPMAPFPEVKAVIAAALDDLNRYPDGHSLDLRAALAERFRRGPDGVVVGNGSCELLLLLGDVLLEPGDEVVFAEPSFLLYRGVCLRHAARPVAVPLRGHSHDLEAMQARVGPHTKMVVICNPNNPTGTYLAAKELADFVRTLPDDVLVVLDEAYNEFVVAPDWQDTLRLAAEHPNVILLRTFSKIYGLCGLRVGYGLCAPELRVAIDRVRQPFNINRLGQVAALEALRHDDQLLERRTATAGLRDDMTSSLEALGLPVVPSQANFVLVGAEGLSAPAHEVAEALMSRGVIVRDGAVFGLPGWLRVSVGTRHEIDVLLERLGGLAAS